MKKILMLGFEPFGQDSINPALEAIKVLDNKELKGGVIITSSLPVVHQKSIDAAIQAINVHKPDIVITVGQASGRFGITPERVAINLDDYRIKDNEGNQLIDEPVVEDAPAAYFSTLPIKSIVKKLQEEGIPSSISNTAGTFVCNHIFYGVHHYIEDNNLNIKHGFVHVPALPEQVTDVSTASMSLDLISKGLYILAQTVIDNDKDIKMQAGTIC